MTKKANVTVDALRSLNFPVLTRTGVETTVDQALILTYPRCRFSIFTELATNICVFHLVPGVDGDCAEPRLHKKRDRVMMIALCGTGNTLLPQDYFSSSWKAPSWLTFL